MTAALFPTLLLLAGLGAAKGGARADLHGGPADAPRTLRTVDVRERTGTPEVRCVEEQFPAGIRSRETSETKAGVWKT
jgi:hypothetical protein